MKPEDFYYPEALEWMWNRCTPLGKFEYGGRKFDLGVHQGPGNQIFAIIVHGPKDGDYLSEPIGRFEDDPLYKETWKRWGIRKSSTVGRVETMLKL